MKWLALVFVIVILGAIAILLYKDISQILSYKLDNRMKNPTVRKWCALHNRYFLMELCVHVVDILNLWRIGHD